MLVGACLLCRGWSFEEGVYVCRGRVQGVLGFGTETGSQVLLECRVRCGRSPLLGGLGSRGLRHLRGPQWLEGKRASSDLRQSCRRFHFRAMLSSSLRILDAFFFVALRRHPPSQRDQIRHHVCVEACRC